MSRGPKKNAVETIPYHASEELYQALFDQAADGIFIADAQGRYVEVNRHGCEMLGYTREEMLDLSIEDLIPAKDLARDPLQLDELRAGRTPLKERQLRTKDGRLLPVEISARALSDGNFLGMVRDISERKRAEELLHKREHEFRTLMENSPDFIGRYNRDARVVYVNPALERLFGRPLSHLLGKTSVEISPGVKGAQLFDTKIREVLETGSPVETEIIVDEVPGQGPFYHHLHFVPERDHEGQIVSVLFIGRDITALKETERQFRTLTEHSPDIIARFDREGHYLYVNRAVEKIAGIPAQELLGQRIGEALSERLSPVVPEEVLSLRQTIEQVFITGTAIETEIKLSLSAGEYIFNVRLIPEYNQAGQVASVLYISCDITKAKRVERELQRSNDLLRAIIEAAPTAIIGLDLDGNVQMVWNPAAEKMLGWSAQEVIGHPLPSVPVESQEEFRSFREKIRRGLTLDGMEVRRQRRDGSPIDYSIYASPLHDTESRIIGNLAVLVDITERKRIAKAQQKSHEELRAFFSQTIDGCFFMMLDEPIRWDETTDKEGVLDYVFAHQHITQINEAMLAQYGATREQMLKLTPNDFFKHNLTHGRDLWRRLFDAGKIRLESDERKLDGTPMWIEGEYIVLYDSEGRITGHFGIQRDVTERKQMEAERQAHLRFFESMDQVNRAIQGTNDLEQMMRDVLDTVLSIFDCDRAWLVYPCDPEAASWRVPMERTRPEYPGALALGVEVPMDPEVATVSRILRISNDPVKFGPGSEHRVPAGVAQDFNVQSFIAIALHPKVGQPWMFGLHHCSYPRVWTPQEERLFQEIGRRLSDALTSLLAYRNLRESERKLEEAQRIAHVGYWDHDLETDRITWSDETYRIFGLRPQERILNPVQLEDLIHPEDRQIMVQAVAEALRGGPRYDAEYRVLRPSGEVRIVRSRGDVTWDESGRPRRIFGIMQDITELRQAEEALRESAERLRLAAQASNVGLWDWDLQANQVVFSREWKSQLGYEEHEIGADYSEWERRVHPDDLAPTLAALGAYRDGRHPEYAVEFRLQHKDGSYRWIYARGEVFHGTRGKPVRMLGCHVDITKRKQAEEALRESETRQRAVLTALPDLMFLCDADGRFVDYYAADPSLLFLPPDDFLGKTVTEAIPPELAATIETARTETLRSGQVQVVEFAGTVAAGLRHFEARFARSGETYTVTIVRDITERWQAEEALRTSEERFRALYRDNPSMFFTVDAERIVISVNAFGASQLGYTIDELEGQSVLKVFYDDDKPAVVEQVQKCLRNPGQVYTWQYRKVRKDGSLLWVEEFAQAISSPEGTLNVLIVCHDITERKQAEEEIQRRNRELALLNRIIAASVTANDAKTILEITCRELALAFNLPQAAAFLLNEEKTEAAVVAEHLAAGQPTILGQTIPVADFSLAQDIISHKTLVVDDAQNDPRLAAVRHLVEQRSMRSLLMVPLIITGEVIGSLSLAATEPHPFSAEEINLARSVASQVGGVLARLRLDEQRRQLQAQYYQSQKMEAIGQLTGGVAHDFNNILTVIMMNSNFILGDLDQEHPLRPDIEQIQKTAERAASLTRQLLAFSRQQVLQPRVLNLNNVVVNIEKMLRRLIGEHIDLVTMLDPQLGTVKADPGQLEQVIMNLVVNARDAMPEGGKLTLETANVYLDEEYARQHIGVEAGSYVTLAISDTGLGMDTETRARIFEPFFTTKEPDKGTGLGLATVHGIVNQSGGHIWVYSEPGQGTTFKIYLPQTDATGKVVEPRQTPLKIHRGSETILLVEDERMVRELAYRTLVNCGYTVLAAGDSEKARQVCAEHDGPIHLLLTDVIIPGGMTGVQLAAELVSLHPQMKVLYMSGYTDNAIVHNRILDPGIAFLPKPFGPNDLVSKVRQVLDATADGASKT